MNIKLMTPALIVSLFCIVFLGGCHNNQEVQIYNGTSMGTTYRVQIGQETTLNSHQIEREIKTVLKEVNAQMSTYDKDSEISKFNSQLNLKAFEISPWFYEVLSFSIHLAEETEGVYDPTLGPLVNLWGFGPDSRKGVPEGDEVQKVKEYVGYDKVIMYKQGDEHFIKKKAPKIYLDLSSSAKGFAVDQIALELEDNNITDYFVEVGGEIRAQGKKFDKPWVVAIETPDSLKREAYKKFPLHNLSIATSGSYRNFFKDEGEIYSHTIDSKTGRPVRHRTVSVTVIHESCMKADAIATALMAMGAEKAEDFAEKNKYMVYMIYNDSEKEDEKLNLKTFASKAFQKKIQMLK